MLLEVLAGQSIRSQKCQAWATAQVTEQAATAAAAAAAAAEEHQQQWLLVAYNTLIRCILLLNE
jgi:hypothetical protein